MKSLEQDHAGLKALKGITLVILAADVLLVVAFLWAPEFWLQ